MPPRKRKRDQAFIDEAQPDINETNVALSEERRAEKEQEIWDAIREMHYEAIEQLPLTLHRQLSLMRQLDEQSFNYTNRLLPSLHKYIQYRQAMDSVSETQPIDDIPVVEADGQSNQPNIQQDELSNTDPGADFNLVSPMKGLRSEATQPLTQTLLEIPPGRRKSPKTNRELLSHVAWLSEELLRAAQEKVCLAQAANDSVERHIRLLDQAIKEQEAESLPLNSANGTSIHLPDLVIPSRNRNARRTVSDIQNISINVVHSSSDIDEIERRSRGKGGKECREMSGNRNGASANSGKDSAALTITLPATQPSEELYCYCNRVSFGKMIACDNESCKHEWFHLGCVGLMEIPKGKWFCEYCRFNDDL